MTDHLQDARAAYLAQLDQGIRRANPHPHRVLVDGVVAAAAHTTTEADQVRDGIVSYLAAADDRDPVGIITAIQVWDGTAWVDVDEATVAPLQDATVLFAAYVAELGAPKPRAKRARKA